jgi:alanine dehydrogenase
MKVGTVKEIKTQEYRVGLTPDGAKAFVEAGHSVFAQKGAGAGSGFTDSEFASAGATLLDSAEAVYSQSDLIIKVKEPLADEYQYLRSDLIIYAFLHLAADRPLTEAMLESGVAGVAFETITDKKGALPCLKPMSEIAGRLSIQEGAKYLERPFGGRGVLLGGVPGVPRGKVVVIGGGIAGSNACKMAVGLGADVTVLDLNLQRLTELDDLFEGRVTTLYSSPGNLELALSGADLVVGSVLVPGLAAPKIVKREHLKLLNPGAVIVDIAIDQGGCFETSHLTYHDNPIFVEEGINHYCVGNMPGAVPRTSTMALANTTLPFGLQIAKWGLEAACAKDPHLAAGVNTYGGKCCYENVAISHGMKYEPVTF